VERWKEEEERKGEKRKGKGTPSDGLLYSVKGCCAGCVGRLPMKGRIR
jgi:hypothetical protein